VATHEPVPEDEVRAALGEFDGLWEAMQPTERARLLRLLIEQVDYDGSAVSITFHPAGFPNLLKYISQTAAKEVA
jgi:site-specific DNA recombinase